MFHIDIVNVIAIFIGIFSFMCFNLSYAILAFHSCQKKIKIMSWSLSILSSIMYLKLCIHSPKALSVSALIVRNIIPSIAIVLICGWLILVSLAYLFQYQVLYTDSHIRKDFYEHIKKQVNKFEDINLITPDQIDLQGYLYKDRKNEKTPLAIYFGGRGEEATNIAEYASKITADWALAFINYRGCGFSTGRQNNVKLFLDATFIYDYFSKRDDIDNKNIVIISHSLGTGVAIHLASQRYLKGIILSCPYDKYVTGVIQEKLPLIPINLLIKEEYNSISIVKKLKVPVLFLLAEDDKTVLRSRSMHLFNQWGGKRKKLSIIKGTNHENVTFNNFAWDNINTVLDNTYKNHLTP